MTVFKDTLEAPSPLLWVHKYRPISLDSLDFHNHLTETLKHLSSGEDFPHLLVYGPQGAGKKTRVLAVLRELFGPSVLKIKVESRQLVVNKETSRKVDVNIVSSVHHSEITPSESGNQDRVVIQEFLKEMAQTQQVDTSAKHRFKVVLINEADRLTRDAQAALRRTMEVYSGNLRLILLANSTSNIMGPIRSRVLLVRVPAPSGEEIKQVLTDVASEANENIAMENTDITLSKIVDASGRNLRKALLMLQALHSEDSASAANGGMISAKAQVPQADWEVVINGIADSIIKSHTVRNLAEIRSTNYELMAHCIPASVILKNLLVALLARISDNSKRAQIIEYGALFDHRLKQGSKEIFHLEAFIARTMQVLQS